MTCGPPSSAWRLWGSRSSWALAWAFAFASLQPVTAVSMSEERPPSDSSPNEGSSLSKVSAELLARLEALLADSETALNESETLRQEVTELRLRLTALSSESENWRKDSEALSNSLDTLTKEFADYQAAAADRARLDQAAVDRARGERDLWRSGAVVAGVLALVAVIWGASR